jgi:YegS/Rv2252/BmrU family lipid kinase
MRPLLIVNPASGNGRGGRRFEEMTPALRTALGPFDVELTRAQGDASRIARAARGRAGLVVAVGGDGTASEVVDGLVGSGPERHPELELGYLPLGTAGDLRRSLGAGAAAEDAIAVLAGGVARDCDVGRIEYRDHAGERRSRHFVNVADLGVGGLVVEAMESRALKALGPRLSYLVASASALLRYRDRPVRWRVDGGAWSEEALTSLNVCNGRYFGAGMLVAPDARMDDGLFDVVVWKGFGFVDLALRKRRLYDGSHVALPNTRVLRAREVEVEPAAGARVLLDVDGEQPGTIPARFTVLPAALRVRASA